MKNMPFIGEEPKAKCPTGEVGHGLLCPEKDKRSFSLLISQAGLQIKQIEKDRRRFSKLRNLRMKS